MKEFIKYRALQSNLSERDYDIIQVTSLILSANITLYFAMGGFWGYYVGAEYRRYQLANQTCNRADYGTMAGEA